MRAQRAQMNQVEQMPIFFVLMWTCAVLVNGHFAGAVGLVWVFIRIGYSSVYRSTKERSTILSFTLPAYTCLVIFIVSIMYAAFEALLREQGLGGPREAAIITCVLMATIVVLGARNAKRMLGGYFDDKAKSEGSK